MLKKNIILILTSKLSLFYLKTVFDKIKNANNYYFYIFTNSSCANDPYIKYLLKNKKVEIIILKEVKFSIFKKIDNTIKFFYLTMYNYCKIIFYKIKLLNNTKTFIFDEFNNNITFQVLAFFRKNYTLIQANQFLRINNIKEKNFTKNYIKCSIFFLSIIFLRKLYLSEYSLDKSYFKNNYYIKHDYYLKHGLSLKDNFKQIRIKPSYIYEFVIKKNSNLKNEVLFIFSKIENHFHKGINFNNSYKNIFNYLKNLNLPINIKFHPGFSSPDINFFKEYIDINKIKIIDSDYCAEFYISKYKYVCIICGSNSIKHFFDLFFDNKISVISFINLIEFENDEVKKKFHQYLDATCYKYKKMIEIPQAYR